MDLQVLDVDEILRTISIPTCFGRELQGKEDLDLAVPLVHPPEQDSRKHGKLDHEPDGVVLPCCKELNLKSSSKSRTRHRRNQGFKVN